MIIRGTTPTHTFVLPMDVSLCSKLRVIYAQDDKVVIKVENDRFKRDGKTISCVLTQEETLALDCKKYCDIQLRVLTHAGEVLAGEIEKEKVGRCLDDEVMK